jgi:hypothetical protein
MNGIHNPLYLAALNNERIAERRVVALEELAADARRSGIRRRRHMGNRLVRLLRSVWTRQPRFTTHAG